MRSSKRSAKQPATKWLERALAVGPYLTLCCTEGEYLAVCDHLKVPVGDRGQWLRAGGTTHFMLQEGKNLACIVCVDLTEIKKRPISEVANILVHEAVHVWQAYCRDIGETSPSDEFEAYSIQAIFFNLFLEALRRRG